MSNKTQLQTNNSTLDALITRVNAAKETAASLPEAGGSGGGSVETCAVTITNYSNEDFNAIITTVIENGQEVPYVLVRNNGDALSNSQTINNLKCGAIIIIVYDVTWSHSSSVIPLTEVDCGANFISISKLNNYGEYVYVFTAPTVANSNSTIICEIEL